MRQRLRADLDDHAFCPFDLLFRVQESRVLLQRRQDRLVKSKRGNLAGRLSASGRVRAAAAKSQISKNT